MYGNGRGKLKLGCSDDLHSNKSIYGGLSGWADKGMTPHSPLSA